MYDDGNGNSSTQTQNVTVFQVDTLVTSTGGNTLIANTSSAIYQWLDCDNSYAIISGETNQLFTPTVTGNYAVEVTQNGCSDTSSCYLIDYTGLTEIDAVTLVVYPNPTKDGIFTIKCSSAINQIEVVDMLGRIIHVEADLSMGIIDGSSMEMGTYLVRVFTEEQVLIED